MAIGSTSIALGNGVVARDEALDRMELIDEDRRSEDG